MDYSKLPSYSPRFPAYRTWQEKIWSIGQEQRARGRTIGDKRGHLREEYFEIGTSVGDLGLEPSSANRRKLAMEIGDVMNVSAIMLALLERRVPLRTMLLKLAVKSDKYGTEPVTGYCLNGDYTEADLFEYWSQEIWAIGKREDGRDVRVSLIDDRFSVLSAEHVSMTGRLDKLCRLYQEAADPNTKTELLERVRGLIRQTEPEVVEDLGDILNLGAIIVSLMGEDVPWAELKGKLDEKDKKYKTGPHYEKHGL